MTKTLFDEMRSEQNLFAAWRHVKRSALKSANSEIAGQAAEFEHRHQTHLKTIGRQLRESRFVFDGVTGVLKDKRMRLAQKKNPRPIAVASLRNRVVQRAILQVLQPRRARDTRDIDTRYETLRDERLGKINQINVSKYGVGGLIKPYGGVRPAIELINDAVDNGSRFFFQSDIKAFFTKIPTGQVVDFVRRETCDEKLSELFARGLEVNLANKDELATYAKLFPSGGIGVAQGSSLSAFAGNVLLYELDQELNQGGVTAVRYIDDLLMVAPDREALEKAIAHAKERLEAFDFQLYKPSPGSDKAAEGECGPQSINFLGCMLQPKRCVPSAKSVERLNRDVSDMISKSKAAINASITQGKKLPPSQSESFVIQAIGKKVYGWQKSFAFCSETSVFASVDADIQTKVSDYRNWVHKKSKSAPVDVRMVVFGVPQTEHMPIGEHH
ncbi:reverse transcriptase domain-containing protein [Tritonibacter scottomollicae]|uniref:Reverse transcriptase (RNA-dependent DNA polymerase) n=1 Tax=Tritonibacter scottomollicae TaxID=483013 RepID=A0A2T1ABM7_TRISK|nr:reverse transcriptase domain-containing protein [Tritonibacter scottomollicae]PRZ46000.1 reverse transcriptase (RNA-dependent DNA polymerase) [Tritonibacter scottomollicae]